MRIDGLEAFYGSTLERRSDVALAQGVTASISFFRSLYLLRTEVASLEVLGTVLCAASCQSNGDLGCVSVDLRHREVLRRVFLDTSTKNKSWIFHHSRGVCD